MRLRVCGALLVLLSACATSTPNPKEREQLAPASPLVVPKPVTVPVPIGLNPPAPFMVVPEAQPSPRPKSSPDKNEDKEPAPAMTSERRPECIPQPVPHLGGDALHDMCADRIPQNGFPGFDVLVNGKRFDALQLAARVLWEVKTDNFDTYTADLKKIVIGKQVSELRRERDLARVCGFDFWVGVRSAAHKAALLDQEGTLNIAIMNWC